MNKNLLSLLFLLTIPFFSLAGNTINISTNNTQLVLKVDDNGRLYQTYLGKRLSSATPLENLPSSRLKLTSTSIKGYEAYPVMGTEDYYEPAMEITHADGNPTSVLTYISHDVKQIEGGTETTILLKDKLYPVSVSLHYVAYQKENVIRQWSEIKQEEKGKVYLSRYASSMLYFEAAKYYLREFGSDWANEMRQQDNELNFGRKIIDSRLGTRADMLAQPFFEVGIGNKVSENHGQVLLGTLGWTGNFRFTFEVDHDGALRVISGINPDASRYLLRKGDVFRTPDFFFTLSQNGVGEASRNLHHFMLNYQLCQGAGNRLTLLNNWENTYFNFDEDKLTELFKEAKSLGVDLFLLDDGWFGNKYPRKDDHAGLGDWQVTQSKLPHGLPFLVQQANNSGVDFGLWIEPEMVNPSSELAEKHPDWILRLPNRDTYYFRNQLVLDLCNPKVQNFVFSVVDDILSKNPNLKFLKWDCNSPITNIYSPYERENQGNLYIDYVRGFYHVLDRIRQKYPNVMMMMCSGGGGRTDYEGLKYFTEFWCSDNTNPVDRLYIQWGYSQFMPSKAMCAHVTNWNSKAPIKFRVDVAFGCKLGFDIALNNMPDNDLTYCKQAIKEYNRLKSTIYSPDVYRLVSPYEGNHCALQYLSTDKNHALLLVYDIHPRYGENTLPVCMQALDANAQYLVKEICLMPGNQSWLECNGKVYSGDYLMKIGLPVLSNNDLTSHIIEITKQ